MNRTARTIGILIAIVTSSPFLGCATTPSEPFRGQVVEEGTSQPIPGTIVVGRWQETRSSIVDAHTVCVHVESATTDTQGHYQLPRYKGREPTLVDAYKMGYQRSADAIWNQAFNRESKYLLKVFAGSREERFKSIRMAGVSCPNAGESEKNLISLYRAIYEQLRLLAVTKEEKATALSYLRAIENLELPYDEALKRDLERRQALRNEKE